MPKPNLVFVRECDKYDEELIHSLLPEELFTTIQPGDTVVIKPNWVMESHKARINDWEYVITHPAVITAVLHRVMDQLAGKGSVVIIDGPLTEVSFEKLIRHYPVTEWKKSARQNKVSLEIIDLRDYEWTSKNGIIVQRKPLRGDPKGKVLIDLPSEKSEFWNHKKSKRGYYGADYDRAEVNNAHNGHHNFYSVSKTVIESDVFINIPKLKTHRKAGITSCLKNLVGINTYKNYLPHYNEGCPDEGGDQFASSGFNSKIEGRMIGYIKQNLLNNIIIAWLMSPFYSVGKLIFGESGRVARNGDWYGNDTVWRMILDLNKILFYSNCNGEMIDIDYDKARKKTYIGIVDAVIGGEGDGPLLPDPIVMNKIVCGTNPVAIDAVCAGLMGFNPFKIPTIYKAIDIVNYPICDFRLNDIEVIIGENKFSIDNIPLKEIVEFRPQQGWLSMIESSS